MKCYRIEQKYSTCSMTCMVGFESASVHKLISSLYVCMVNIKLKYNFVETPRKFTVAKLSIRKLGSSPMLIIMKATSVAML